MVNVDVVDPYASSEELEKEYNIKLLSKLNGNKYDAVIVAVNHSEYEQKDQRFFKDILTENGLVVDIKGIYRGSINDLNYWSL